MDPLKSFDPIKTHWKETSRSGWSFYCPLCKVFRRISQHPRPESARHIVQIGLTSLAFTLGAWSWFSWKGIVSFVPIWAVFEMIYRIRIRGILRCPHCGFDPVLFLSDTERAKKEVESHWRKVFAEKGIPYPGVSSQTSPPSQHIGS